MFDNVRAVLFDLDGTLIDRTHNHNTTTNKKHKNRGLPSLPLEKYRPMAGAGARGMLGIAFGMTPDAPDYNAMREEFFVNYENAMTERTVIFDGVPALIASLLELGGAWGVVTNKSMRFTGPLTKQIPFFRSAGAIVGGDSTPLAKPHPEPLFEAARRLKHEPGQCIYVGDDERDIVAGRAAGMATVAAAYGYLGSNADVYVWKADAHIASPLELLTLLKTGAGA